MAERTYCEHCHSHHDVDLLLAADGRPACDACITDGAGLAPGQLVTWGGATFELQRPGCATYMAQCPNENEHGGAFAGLHVDRKGKRASTTQCLPADKLVVVLTG
jgi:hypothetical protein